MRARPPAIPSAILSIRLEARLKEDLGRLARSTKRSKSYLAAEAIEVYVARELDIIEDIEQGLADMQAGRVVTHDVVTADMRKVIKKARQGRRGSA